MKQLGLVTLGDLPPLAGNDRSATIAIARLDDNLRDPRYGRFKIQQSDVDGWRRNLDEVFGGRVSIDFDHSSDRGKGTRAAAWITGIGQEGKLVTADVTFTPSGAKAVRDGDYRMISPTFVQNYVDEHGVSHGRALLGAALTNRPVLRKGMPAVALSRDASKALKKATKKARKKAEAKQLAKASKKAAKRLRKQIKALSAPAYPGLRPGRHWGDPTTVQAAGVTRTPPGLDDDRLLLHATIAGKAAREGTHFFQAMGDLTGNDSYRQLSDIPPTPSPPDLPGSMTALDPERSALYAAARVLAISQGVSFFDALEMVNAANELRELEADDGSSPTPWLDSTVRPDPPKPWSEDDWLRDQRRAAAAGVDVDHATWLAGAELGTDVVGQLADAQRATKIAAVQERSAGALEQARRREDERRVSAINDELTSRARQRTQQAQAQRAASTTPAYNGSSWGA